MFSSPFLSHPPTSSGSPAQTALPPKICKEAATPVPDLLPFAVSSSSVGVSFLCDCNFLSETSEFYQRTDNILQRNCS